MSKAFVQKPAPEFKGTAVLPNGAFKEVKLSDYQGVYVDFHFLFLRDWYPLRNFVVGKISHICSIILVFVG